MVMYVCPGWIWYVTGITDYVTIAVFSSIYRARSKKNLGIKKHWPGSKKRTRCFIPGQWFVLSMAFVLIHGKICSGGI